MKYRVKEVEVNGQKYYYPQYKKGWFWRRFVWLGGEDGYTPHTVFYTDMNKALWKITEDKLRRKQKALTPPKQTKYYYID